MFLLFIFRFTLNFEECLAGRDYESAALRNCNLNPFWALIMNHCSQVLLCVNASMGFLVYCIMSSDFRKELTQRFESWQCKRTTAAT